MSRAGLQVLESADQDTWAVTFPGEIVSLNEIIGVFLNTRTGIVFSVGVKRK